MNWMPLKQKFTQCANGFKYAASKRPAYISEIFEPANCLETTLRNSYLKLKHPFRKTTIEYQGMSFLFSLAF